MSDVRKFNVTVIVRGDTGVTDRQVLEQINRLLSITPRTVEDAIVGTGAKKAVDAVAPIVDLVVLPHRFEIVPEEPKQFGRIDATDIRHRVQPVSITHAGGYDPRKGTSHPDNRDETLEAVKRPKRARKR